MTTPRTNPTPLRPPPWRLSPIPSPSPRAPPLPPLPPRSSPCLTSPPPPPSPNLEPESKPKPTKASPAPSASPPGPGKVLPKRRKWARANQSPGPCTFCKAAATGFRRRFTPRIATITRTRPPSRRRARPETKLPSHAYAKHVHPACQDESYWAHAVARARDGNQVLAGRRAGLVHD